jgi:hypothetical protein
MQMAMQSQYKLQMECKSHHVLHITVDEEPFQVKLVPFAYPVVSMDEIAMDIMHCRSIQLKSTIKTKLKFLISFCLRLFSLGMALCY